MEEWEILYSKEESKTEESKNQHEKLHRKDNYHMTLDGVPKLDFPAKELQNSKDLRQSSKRPVIFDLPRTENVAEDGIESVTLPQKKNQLLSGDILLRVKHRGAFSNSLVCRIWFNTSFTYDKWMKYTIKDVDPVSIRKNDKYSNDFSITLVTEPSWKICSSQTPLDNLCSNCRVNLETEIKRWKTIHKILNFHNSHFKEYLNFESAWEMHYNSHKNNDYLEVLQKDNDFRKQSFRWSKSKWGLEQFVETSESDDEWSGSEQSDKEFSNDLFSKEMEDNINKFKEIKVSKFKSHDPRFPNEFIPLDDMCQK